ncbi:hypothetical protein CL3_19210 [butyrate-producing bacterium SM4/1]|nr:hypothetical protein CLS_30850 [[Clostridium] cf. saccharolyticum K10]CBL36355.1 hypothetical protein CL3_19210 [butyrate-producing bacterium SM4/1]
MIRKTRAACLERAGDYRIRQDGES